jgi:tetratricopeptide (TPR) repeat protein
VQLFHEGSYEAALAEFHKAYQIAPSYRILFNLAQVHYELHDYVGALRSFRQYLTEGAAEIGAERRAQVEAEIGKLQGRVAFLDIDVQPAGADVLVDDVPVGMSPLDKPVLVNAGIRRVTAAKGGRTSPLRSVTVAGGDRVTVAVQVPDPPAARPVAALATGAGPAAPEPRRISPLVWWGGGATAVLAGAAGGFAVAASQAKKSFDRELQTFPTTKERVDQARGRMVTLAGLTDGLTAAALVAGGITLVLALTGGSDEHGHALAIGLSPGGATLAGRF